MFPERQSGPHRDWKQEVEYLDNIFKGGAAYTIGKVNGDHWLLYLTTPEEGDGSHVVTGAPSDPVGNDQFPDFTIEILMSGLATEARQRFFSSLSPSDDLHDHASVLSDTLGISEIFPPHLTTLDAYSFSPCGYSANALIKWGADPFRKSSPVVQANGNGTCGNHDDFREGYYTIHVTPEEGWSYASFECNVPSHSSRSTRTVPDLKSLVQRVVTIFQPARLTLTLFISNGGNEAEQGESIEAIQRAFKRALTEADFGCGYPSVDSDNGQHRNRKRLYKRTDKINYELGGYELAFASFELEHKAGT